MILWYIFLFLFISIVHADMTDSHAILYKKNMVAMFFTWNYFYFDIKMPSKINDIDTLISMKGHGLTKLIIIHDELILHTLHAAFSSNQANIICGDQSSVRTWFYSNNIERPSH